MQTQPGRAGSDVRLTVILATDSLDPSGVGHHMIALAGHLDPRFRPVLGFAEGPTASHFLARARSAGIEAQAVAKDAWPDWTRAQQAQLQHVHAGIGWEGHALVAAGKAAGLPVVRTEHLPWLITDPQQRQDYVAMLRKVDRLIAVSPSSGSSWRQAMRTIAPRMAVTTIANGIASPKASNDRHALRSSLGIEGDEPTLLHVGRFTPQKAHPVLIEAFASVKNSFPAARLILIGSGEMQGEIEAMIAERGLDGVRLLPPQSDVAAFMQASDLLVLPSLFEGLPLVLLEAMSIGLPIVATRIGGITDALGQAYPFLVPPGDAAALERQIIAGLSNPSARQHESLRQKRRFATHFTAERMAAETAGLYRDTLRHKALRGRSFPMQKAIRLGFIGSGGIAQRHLGVLRHFPDVQIAAISDPDTPRASETAKAYNAQGFESYDEMLERSDLDAVYICIPPAAHGPAERAAIAAGLPFFVEKPITLDIELAETIAAEVGRAGLITAVGYHWRYLDTVDAARKALADRDPQLMIGHWLDQTPPVGWWGRQDQSGGQFVEQVTHLLDTARFLGGGIRSVYAQASHLPRDRFPDLDVATAGSATLTFASGAVASFSATCLLNWNHRTGLHVFADGLAIELSDMEVMIDVGQGRHPHRPDGDPVWREDRDFIDAVQGRENRIRTDYAEALATHRVALAISRSMQTGEVQHLPPDSPRNLPAIGTLRHPVAGRDQSRRIRSLGVERPHQAYFFDYEEGPAGEGQVRMDLCYTGLSAGTELTFLKNTNPYLFSRWDDEAGVFREGEPSARYPIPFMGYMEVGRVIDSRAPGFANGDLVAASFGHKTGHTATPDRDLLIKLPDALDPMLGVFVAQMGPIAANGILHADAIAHGQQLVPFGSGVAGRRVVVWGGGTVGLLTALFAKMGGAETVLLAEPSAFRRGVAERLGFEACDEDQAWQTAKAWGGPMGRGADIVFQTRAHSGSLNLALKALRPQGTVVDLAFYQGGMEGARLGEEFHHNGLSLVCAQIGRVPPGLLDAWPRTRLSEQTLQLLAQYGAEIRDLMITHVVPLDDAPQFLSDLIATRPEFLQVVFEYAV